MKLRKKVLLSFIVLAVAAGLISVLLVIVPGSGRAISPGSMAVAVIVGAACLVAIVLLLIVVFSWLGLTDVSQALALPDGSVRALIALILLSAFISVPLYLYNSLNNDLKFIDGVPAADKADAINALPKGEYAFALPSGPKDSQVFRIYYRDVNTVTDDFAKEILTAMITLVASVSSFYFGAGVAKSAQGGGTVFQPAIIGVNPAAGTKGTTVSLEITGSGLDLVSRVRIARGGEVVSATNVTSNATLIKCSLVLPASITSGNWSVIAETADRKTTGLDDGFEVK